MTFATSAAKAEPAAAKRWTQEQVDALGADKGFLPDAYWPERLQAKGPRLPEALCDPTCAGLCKAPCKPWCGTCGLSVENVAYLDINGDCASCFHARATAWAEYDHALTTAEAELVHAIATAEAKRDRARATAEADYGRALLAKIDGEQT